ncbi:39S ribosomal protein L21, mitochondrial [Wyeomyia smithii]|uniref:39S ribosomal protein L21, mitochondrial n=1 Tax=Wyeomyia smithii TaxID=174621 RepID=UPI002467B7EB|nr:39S ribosomal protein L21, mitochondrial [Wyeomyia smithii]
MFAKQISLFSKWSSLLSAFKNISLNPSAPSTALAGASKKFSLSAVCSRFSSTAVVPQLTGKSVVQQVNQQIASGSEGRLFAVVQLCGKQFKITTGDIVIVEGYWPPTNGDRIRLDKVLVAGGKDFSLIGRPLVSPGLVEVQATIIEKTLSHTRTHFKKKRRKQYMRINFYRTQQTMLRINSIEINPNGVEEHDETKQVERFF